MVSCKKTGNDKQIFIEWGKDVHNSCDTGTKVATVAQILNVTPAQAAALTGLSRQCCYR